MKTFNIFSKLIALTIVFGMCFTSCQKDKAPDLSTKKAEIGFNFKLATPEQNKKGDSEFPDYYGSKCLYSDADYVVVEYTLGESEEIFSATLDILNRPSDDGEGFVATQLIQIELADATSTEQLTVTSFKVYQKIVDGDDTVIMATPEKGSAFEGYVNNAVGKKDSEVTFTISAFEKVYTPIDVLCFQPDDYLEFGFTWFDFNIVEGEVISVFFNCINADNRERYHEVLPVAIDVYQGVKSGEPYIKDLKNYSIKEDYSIFEEHFEGTRAINIEVPGLYNIEPSASDPNPVVMTVVVKPWGSNEEIDIPLTKEEIDIYTDKVENFVWEGNGAVNLDYFKTNLYVGDFVKGENNEKVMHFQLNECYKPEVAYVDNNGTSVLYAVVPVVSEPDETGKTVSVAKMTVIDELDIQHVHIAMSPAKRQIFATDRDNANIIYVYDLFDMKKTPYEYIENNSLNNFTELVYGKNAAGEETLYASCQKGQIIKEIVFLENNKFDFVNIAKDTNLKLSGGDLILDNNGNLFSICNDGTVTMYKVNFSDFPSSFEEYTINVDPNALKDVTGATILKDGKIITSHAADNFKLWTLDTNSKTLSLDVDGLTPEYPLHSGGDMASIFAGLN